jgi:hypothetical protein
MPVVIPGRQIDQDRVGIIKNHVAVFENRDLAKGILCQKIRPFVRATGQIDIDQRAGQSEQPEEQLHPVGMT